jgi:hypothetical protein
MVKINFCSNLKFYFSFVPTINQQPIYLLLIRTNVHPLSLDHASPIYSNADEYTLLLSLSCRALIINDECSVNRWTYLDNQ